MTDYKEIVDLKSACESLGVDFGKTLETFEVLRKVSERQALNYALSIAHTAINGTDDCAFDILLCHSETKEGAVAKTDDGEYIYGSVYISLTEGCYLDDLFACKTRDHALHFVKHFGSLLAKLLYSDAIVDESVFNNK